MEAMPVKIMTSNIWGDYFGNPVQHREDQLCNICKKYAPDIIGFQEVTVNWYASSLFNELKDDYAFAGTEIGDNTNFVPLAYKKHFKLIAKGFEYFTDTPDITKAITWTVLQDTENDVLLAVCNTHFWWVPGPEHDLIRVKNSDQLVSLMKFLHEKYGCPVFAFGDMNCTIDAEVFTVYGNNGIKHLYDMAVHKDDISSHHGDPQRGDDGLYHGCKTSHKHDRSIDHIIAFGDGFAVTEYRIITDQDALDATDHSPVYAEIEF